MTEAEKKHYLQLKEFHLAQYFQRGRIIPLPRSDKRSHGCGDTWHTHNHQENNKKNYMRKLLHEARTKQELVERGVMPEVKPAKRIKTEFLGPAFTEDVAEDGTSDNNNFTRERIHTSSLNRKKMRSS